MLHIFMIEKYLYSTPIKLQWIVIGHTRSFLVRKKSKLSGNALAVMLIYT